MTGTSRNLKKGRSGHRRTGRSAANIEAVRNVLENHQAGNGRARTISCRRNGFGLPSATFNRITRLDLRFHPYKIIKRHQHLPCDRQRQLQFCQWLLAQHARFLDDLVIGDESGFALINASVNTHIRKYHPRGQQPLDFDYQRNDDRHKITVWVSLMGNGRIIGPFFFRNNLNGDGYLHMINADIVPVINRMPRYRRRRNGEFQSAWWVQDGAPPHRRRIVTERPTELFGNRVIALNRPVEWPPRSPDLTPLDFFLWGHLKYKVFVTSPADLGDLERRITAEINVLMLDRAVIRRAVVDS